MMDFNLSVRVDRGKSYHIMHEIAQAPNLKTIALIKAMYTAICSYYEQAFDNMSEKSGKNKKPFG